MTRPFEIVAGAGASPVVLHVPHSSRVVPPEVRRGIVLPDDALEHELDLMTDAHTLRIASAAAGDGWIFANGCSRLVVDPERFPDDREAMRAVGMGAVYTRTSSGAPLREHDPALLDAYFHPYAAAFTALVDERLAATGRAVIVDVHSYPSRPLPYELRASDPRPPVCVGTDPFHTPAFVVEAARAAFGGETVEAAQAFGGEAVALDTPFSGCYVPLAHYRRNPAVAAVMIELRRDTYMAEPGGPPHDGLPTVIAALRRFIHTISSA